MKVFFTNLGCKLNQAELEHMARQFHGAGHQVVGSLDEAEVHVVNSCTVTHAAARDTRKVARRGSRRHPGLKTVVTGCWASEPETAEVDGGVSEIDLLVPNDQKDNLLQQVEGRFPELMTAKPSGREADHPLDAMGRPEASLAFGNHRGLVKVEDGCNMRCSFCIIPFTRGRQHSRSVAEVLTEIRELVAAGTQEIVVTGVQISSYRYDGGREGTARLYDLTRAILEETDLPRLRLTSIAPWQFDRRLLDLFRQYSPVRDSPMRTDRSGPKLCRHVHMSLQSGSDETLRRMRRPYTGAAYGEVVESIRAAVPGVAITTDVIVGFPGETDDEFHESLEFTRSMAFAKVHVFPYSSRAGTLAAEMESQVPHGVKRERMGRMLAVAEESERRFAESQVGTTLPVLWDRPRKGRWTGMSDNYLKVLLCEAGDAEASVPRRNTVIATGVTGLVDGGVAGRILGSSIGESPMVKSPFRMLPQPVSSDASARPRSR